MNDFSECLAYSLGAQEQFDASVLKKHFSWIETIEKTDIETDKTGIDYIAILKDGSKFTIDAKTRKSGCSQYWKDNIPELCLEKYSICERNVIGWLFKKSKNHPDYILYTFPQSETDKYYLLPYQLLRKAAFIHWREWESEYGEKFQENAGWTSSAIFVPAPVVINAIQEIMEGKT